MKDNEMQIKSLFEYFMVMFSRKISEEERENLIALARYLTSRIN